MGEEIDGAVQQAPQPGRQPMGSGWMLMVAARAQAANIGSGRQYTLRALPTLRRGTAG